MNEKPEEKYKLFIASAVSFLIGFLTFYFLNNKGHEINLYTMSDVYKNVIATKLLISKEKNIIFEESENINGEKFFTTYKNCIILNKNNWDCRSEDGKRHDLLMVNGNISGDRYPHEGCNDTSWTKWIFYRFKLIKFKENTK